MLANQCPGQPPPVGQARLGAAGLYCPADQCSQVPAASRPSGIAVRMSRMPHGGGWHIRSVHENAVPRGSSSFEHCSQWRASSPPVRQVRAPHSELPPALERLSRAARARAPEWGPGRRVPAPPPTPPAAAAGRSPPETPPRCRTLHPCNTASFTTLCRNPER